MPRPIQQFISAILLLGILTPAVILIFALPQETYAADVDNSQAGNRSIEGLVDILGSKRCSVISALLSLEFDCLFLSTIWIVDKFLAGTLLNLATGIFEVSVKANLTDIAKSDFVTTGWGIVRDITNLFFIFILLWIALATIFNIQGYGAKELLGQLIVAALLINFSLAIGGFFINFTNALGRAFLSGIPRSGACLMENTLSCGISNRLLAFADIQGQTIVPIDTKDPYTNCVNTQIDLGAIETGGSVGAFQEKVQEKCGQFQPHTQEAVEVNQAILNAIYQALWLIIIIPILSFVFFAAAIFFLIRYLMLSILLVFTPIVFLFWILPATRSHWNDWWNRLIQWSFFAPAFLFLLFLTIITLEKLSILNVLKVATKGFIAIGFDMVLIIILMIINLMVAQKMGIMFAGSVIGVGSKVAGWTGRKVRGAAYRGAIRGVAPAAQEFMKTGVAQRMAQIPFIRGLTQPAVAIQQEREHLDKERADRVQKAIGAMPPEFAAQRLAGETRNVQEAFYKSARPDDIEKIMRGLMKEKKEAVEEIEETREVKDTEGRTIRTETVVRPKEARDVAGVKEVKDTEGRTIRTETVVRPKEARDVAGVKEVKDTEGRTIRTETVVRTKEVTTIDKSSAEKEIIKIRNRDPKLAERIESSVKDLHLKVVASKGVMLGEPVAEAQRSAEDKQRYSNFQAAANAYLNEQSEQKLKQVLSAENLRMEQVGEYMLQNFGAREAKSVSRTTEQVRAFADTLMKAVEKQKKAEFTQRVNELRTQGVSESSSRFLAFQELAPQVIKNPSLQNWIRSAPGVRAIYHGKPIRERGRLSQYEAGGGVAPQEGRGGPVGGGGP